MPPSVPMNEQELPADLRPVVHAESLPDDAHFANPDRPPNEPFEAAGFAVLEAAWQNQPNRQSRFPCGWPDVHNERLQAFRGRYDFASALAGAGSEFDGLVRLRHWVRGQIRGGVPLARLTPDPFEILDLSATGGLFRCTMYAKVFQACALAGGWLSRHLGIGSDHLPDAIANHHGVTDVFVNELGKWVAMDAHYDVHYEKAGVPLAPWEVGEEFFRNGGKDVEVCVGPDRRRVDCSGVQGLADWHESSRYFWNVYRWTYTDPFNLPTMRSAQQLMLVPLSRRHEGKVWHQGSAADLSTRRLHVGYTRGYFQFTRRLADVYPDFGTCRLEIVQSPAPAAVRVKVGTATPNFEALLASADGQPLRRVRTDLDWLHFHGEFLPELEFDWFLHEGENRLSVQTRNAFGLLGKASTVRVVLRRPDTEGA